jgi:hypothetical protein
MARHKPTAARTSSAVRVVYLSDRDWNKLAMPTNGHSHSQPKPQGVASVAAPARRRAPAAVGVGTVVKRPRVTAAQRRRWWPVQPLF